MGRGTRVPCTEMGPPGSLALPRVVLLLLLLLLGMPPLPFGHPVRLPALPPPPTGPPLDLPPHPSRSICAPTPSVGSETSFASFFAWY